MTKENPVKTSTYKITSIKNSLYGDNTAGLGGNTANTLTLSVTGIPTGVTITFIKFTSIGKTGTDTQLSPGNISQTSITCGYPQSKQAGSYTVQVYDTLGKAVFENSITLYIKAPTATVIPASGSTKGGTSVSLTGKYLENASNVLFGTTPASNFIPTNNSPTNIDIKSPANTNKGLTDVKVVFPQDPAGSKVGTFSYAHPKFSINGFYPNFASQQGQTIGIFGGELTIANVEKIQIWDDARTKIIATVQQSAITFNSGSSVTFDVPSGLSNNTNYNLAVVATNDDGTLFATDYTIGHPAFSFVTKASVAATKIYDTALTNTKSSLTIAKLIKTGSLTVYSTGDFTATGDLFVQTTKGVAILSYTGVEVNKNLLQGGYFTGKFTGVTHHTTVPEKYKSLGDFDTSTTSLILEDYASIYQASADTGFTFDITCNSSNQHTTEVSDIEYLAYYNTAVPSGEIPNFYILNLTGEKGSWKAAQKNMAVTTSKLNHGNNQLSLPVIPTNSANFIFTKGSYTPPISTNDSAGVARPGPFTSDDKDNLNIYDFIEFTLDGTAGDPNVTLGTRLLPKLTIDTSQVDQLGLPIQIQATSESVVSVVIDTVPTQTTLTIDEVGVNPALTMSKIFDAYKKFINSTPAYSQTLVPEGDTGKYLRIANPSDVLNSSLHRTTSSLNWVFDKAIHSLFTAPPGGSIDIFTGNAGNLNNATFKGVASTKMIGNDTYKVLKFSSANNPDTGDLYVYMPLFANNKTGAPDTSIYQTANAPSWLTPGQTSGSMVFSNDGAFADAGSQTGLTAEQQSILGNIENQLVVALNRGCVSKVLGTEYTNNTEYWQDPKNHYPAEETANLYAKFMHTYVFENNTIFFGIAKPTLIYGLAYALAYDDQGSLSTTMTIINDITSTSVTISEL